MGYLFQLSEIETQSPQPANRESHLTPLRGNTRMATLPCLVHSEASASAAAAAPVAAAAVVTVVVAAVIVFAIVAAAAVVVPGTEEALDKHLPV